MTWIAAPLGLIKRTPTRTFDLSTPEGRRKASDYRYYRSAKGRAVNREAQKRYEASEKGKARREAYKPRRRETDRAFYARNPYRREYINAKNREYRRRRREEKDASDKHKQNVPARGLRNRSFALGNQPSVSNP